MANRRYPSSSETSSTSYDDYPTKCELCIVGFLTQWRFFFMLVWPFVAGLVFIGGSSPAWRCLYVTILMAGYWICEVIPLGVTALFPVALFPVLEILDTKTTSMQYFSDTNLLFIAAIFIAFAIEATNLHSRVALRIILILGTTHKKLLLGFMSLTACISMWVVNTAATAMMVPIALAVLERLEEANLVKKFEEREGEDEPYPSRTTICYLVGIAYSATIGGIATLVGTVTNLVLKGIYETTFPDGPNIDFVDWLLVHFPIAVVSLLGIWLVLCWQFLGLFRNSGMDPLVKKQKLERPEDQEKAAEIAKDAVRIRLKALGKFSWGESWVSALFIIVIALWITRNPNWMVGWAPRISKLRVSDASPAVMVAILLFMIPSTTAIFYCMSRDDAKRPKKPVTGILTWNFIKVKMLWGAVLLLGSGFALARGFEVSGLSKMIGESLSGLSALSPFVVLMICCLVATNFTEFTSNVAVANILLPVLAQMAIVLEINPLYLMIPTAVCCSFSFMLPVGTPPNAVIAGYGHVRTKDMMLAGIAPTIITYFATIIIFSTLGRVVYNIEGFPDWARNKDET